MLIDDVSPDWKIYVALGYSNAVFILLSAFVNIILAMLIVFRLVYHRRYVQNALGAEHGSPYTNIMTMCVESSALMVIATGLLAPLYLASTYAYFVFIIPHICVGGLELNDFCTTNIFDITRLSPHSSSSIALL